MGRALTLLQKGRGYPAPKRNRLGEMFQKLFDTDCTTQDAIRTVSQKTIQHSPIFLCLRAPTASSTDSENQTLREMRHISAFKTSLLISLCLIFFAHKMYPGIWEAEYEVVRWCWKQGRGNTGSL